MICKSGIHYCRNINDVHQYYRLDQKVICEVEILGDIVNHEDMRKSCTNHIKVTRLLTKEEVFKISNPGSLNSGLANSGDYNSGHFNSGDRNSGHFNSGHFNSGDYNSGDRNSGLFNTVEHPIFLFDKASTQNYSELRRTAEFNALFSEPIMLTEWVDYTAEEKEKDRAKELIS